MKIAKQSVEYLDLAYLAGSMEADGCWYVGGSASMRLTNKSIRLLRWCVDTFGGEIKSKSTPENCYEWTLHGQNAVELTNKLIPFLHSKEEEVKYWLQYQSTIGKRGKKVTEEIHQLRNSLKIEISLARKRRNGENK